MEDELLRDATGHTNATTILGAELDGECGTCRSVFGVVHELPPPIPHASRVRKAYALVYTPRRRSASAASSCRRRLISMYPGDGSKPAVAEELCRQTPVAQLLLHDRPRGAVTDGGTASSPDGRRPAGRTRPPRREP